jgi:hypothetical protein
MGTETGSPIANCIRLRPHSTIQFTTETRRRQEIPLRFLGFSVSPCLRGGEADTRASIPWEQKQDPRLQIAFVIVERARRDLLSRRTHAGGGTVTRDDPVPLAYSGKTSGASPAALRRAPRFNALLHRSLLGSVEWNARRPGEPGDRQEHHAENSDRQTVVSPRKLSVRLRPLGEMKHHLEQTADRHRRREKVHIPPDPSHTQSVIGISRRFRRFRSRNPCSLSPLSRWPLSACMSR